MVGLSEQVDLVFVLVVCVFVVLCGAMLGWAGLWYVVCGVLCWLGIGGYI